MLKITMKGVITQAKQVNAKLIIVINGWVAG